MMHEFDGTDFTEHVPNPCTTGQVVYIEQLYGRVYNAIPKHIRYRIDTWVNGVMNEDEANMLIAELKQYDTDEPVSVTEINRYLKRFT